MVSVTKRRRPGARSRESGISLMIGILSLLFIIPMVGLTIDVGVLYTVKSRLQSAVDGASLAAARSLNIGQSTTAQTDSARQNAVNWFYGNFPNGVWATTNTQMTASSVNVYDDAANPHLRNVSVSATTSAPTYFMKWLGFDAVTVSASGNASRRDVVVMMVLDRSGSMGSVCGNMITAAKIFTGQFAAGRDMIGLVTFNDGVTVVSAPTANFQTVLGYTNSLGSSTGALDAITCGGGTGTAQAISAGYNELYKVRLSGALNVLMFETDGLPNTLTLNFWDSGAQKALLANSSPCQDVASKTMAGGGFRSASQLPNWTSGVGLGVGAYQSDIPAGIVAGIYSSDPSLGSYFDLANYYWNANTYLSSTAARGCGFNSNHRSTADFGYWPTTDVWGNQLNPTSAYKPVTMSNGYVANNGWQNFHNAALNAADNAAYNARTNTTIPAYFFGIALGGNGGDPPDFTLMQRMTNDPDKDTFSGSNAYQACSATPGCINYTNQPKGQLIYSTNSSVLARAFLSIPSQILRLSK